MSLAARQSNRCFLRAAASTAAISAPWRSSARCLQSA
jgi:hypothetical protein